MSLIGALNIGKNALAVSQAAIQTTGNNIANAGNPEYTRQVARLTNGADQEIQQGIFVGGGINLESIRRQVDEALEARLRNSISDQQSADITQQWLSRVEATFNELSDDDLSTQLSTFFNSWSNLANKPQDIGLRQVVLQNGQSLAKSFQDLRSRIGGMKTDVDSRLGQLVREADSIAGQIADLNKQIVISEGGTGGPANGLRDRRDVLLKDLSTYVDIRTIEQPSGSIDVYVGSEPLITAAANRGVALRQDAVDGQLISTVTFKYNDGAMNLTSGQLGALSGVKGTLDGTVANLDALASNLIFELNKVHASGQGLQGFSAITSGNSVDDATVALNDPESGLDHVPGNGSFVVHVRNKSTGAVSSTLVQVDLDGLNGDDSTLTTLAADMDGVAGISASITGNRLRLSTDSNDVEISFSQDSSGVLAALGINTFYTGATAADIAVNTNLSANPQLLAAARNGEPADNQTARLIAALESTPVKALNGISLKDMYQSVVNGVSAQSAAARTGAEAATVVRDTLQAQRESLSGVSLDEEAVNLLRQQRAFQGAARLISIVNEMLESVINMAA